MSIVLKNRIDASERSAQELESDLLRQRRIAILAFDVQDLVNDLVDLFRIINEDVERWQDRLAISTCPELENNGHEWEQLYRRLAALYQRASGLIVGVERFEHSIEGKDSFLSAWKQLRAIVAFSLEDVAAAGAQVRRGEVISLGDATRELWDQPVAPGKGQARVASDSGSPAGA